MKTFNRYRHFLYVMTLLAIGVVACNKTNQTNKVAIAVNAQIATPKKNIRSETDLRKLLIPGMATNEIIAGLGKPDIIDDPDQDSTNWRYGFIPFPADDANWIGYSVHGVTIRITNGYLSKWGCNYFGNPQEANDKVLSAHVSNEVGSATNNSRIIIKFFVVKDNPIVDGRYIDTTQFPKTGYIESAPDLTISKVKEVITREKTFTSKEKATTRFYNFGITLTSDDSVRFGLFTKTNISKRILIMVSDDIISAPRIVGSIDTGSFGIDCSDPALMEITRSNLNKINIGGKN